jgi:hypothetical protein
LNGKFAPCIEEEQYDRKEEDQIPEGIDDGPATGRNLLIEDIDPNMGFEMEGIGCAQQKMGAIKEIGHFIGPDGRLSKNISSKTFVDKGQYIGKDDPGNPFAGPDTDGINCFQKPVHKIESSLPELKKTGPAFLYCLVLPGLY